MQGFPKVPPPPPQTPAIRNENGVELPKIFSYNFDDPSAKKPWTQPNQDITDYFNYGFNEEVWRVYVDKVKKVFEKAEIQKQGSGRNLLINTELPVECGGFGAPLNKDLLQFEAFQVLLKQQEQFWLTQNMASSDFYTSFDQYLSNSVFGANFDLYRSFLLQGYEESGVDLESIGERVIEERSRQQRSNYHGTGYGNQNGYRNGNRNNDQRTNTYPNVYRQFVKKEC